jgi:hypothetical protein
VAGIQLPSPRQLEAVSSLKSVNARDTTTLKHSAGGMSVQRRGRITSTDFRGVAVVENASSHAHGLKSQKRYSSFANSDLRHEAVAIGPPM